MPEDKLRDPLFKVIPLELNTTFSSKRATLFVDQVHIPLEKNWIERPITVTADFGKNFDTFLNFKGQDDDVWVVTLMKSGTTWAQELAWLILNDYDFETASTKGLMERSPYLE